MKYGSRTKIQTKEDSIIKSIVVIDRCNNRKAHETNNSISSVSSSKEKYIDTEVVRERIEAHTFIW